MVICCRTAMGPRRFLLLVIPILILCAGWGIHSWLLVDLPSLEELPDRLAAPSSRVLDRNGRLLYEVIDPNGGGHTPVALSQIPAACQMATIAVEDANYFRHPGVDVSGVLRALWINLRGGEMLAGGSTITQQVARNLLLDPEEAVERTLIRKLRESILAWRLAKAYTKDEVLALYLNQTYYGSLAYGIEAAARAFFGKSAAALDLAECAMLAGLPQAPALFDPLRNPSASKGKQALVLDLMAALSSPLITPEEAERAKKEVLVFAAAAFPIQAPHFVTYVWDQLGDRLGTDVVRAGGLVVTTTLDLELQRSAERILDRHLARLQAPAAGYASRPGRNVHNGGLVALDIRTGEVLVMVGSPDYFDARIDGAVNAALAPRQPGSAIKPFTYAAAFSLTEPWTPATVLLDVRTAFPTREGDPYVPLNYDRTFHGPVSIRQALACSYNIPAVKTLQHVGLEKLVKLAGDLGLSTLQDADRFGLALTLGGGEVRLLELTAAFGALGNGGFRIEPITVQRVTGDGVSLIEPPLLDKLPVLDPRVAWLITDILSDDAARAPSFGRGSVLQLSRPAAVKTGTTTDWRDNWTVGYTPELATGVWVGNADNSPMGQVSGISGAGPIWRDFMETALLGRPEFGFPRPAGLVQAEVCATSGKLPTEFCPHRTIEWFLEGTIPTELDDWHQLFRLDSATGLLADEDTPPERVVERVYLVLPPEAQRWAREQAGLPSAPPPAALQTDGPVTGTAGELSAPLALASPDNGVVYHLSSAVPVAQQKIRLAAVAQLALVRVTLLLNDQAEADFSAPPYELFWILRPGEHRLVAIGWTADGQEIQSEPVDFSVIDDR